MNIQAKKFLALIVTGTLLTSLSSYSIPTAKSAPTTHTSSTQHAATYKPGELVVTYKKNVEMRASGGSALQTTTEKLGKNPHGSLATTYKITLPTTTTVEQAITEYKNNPDVASAEPNYYYYATETPNDPNFAQQIYLHDASTTIDINAPEAWDKSTGSTNTIIAIIDSGIDMNHPEFAGKIAQGYDFIDGDTNPDTSPNGIDDDSSGGIDSGKDHGTHVAGIATAIANNSQFGAGVCWSCKIMPIRALNDEGVGDLSTIALGIDYAVEHDADVINLSLVGNYSTTIGAAIQRAYDAGVVVIAAAGNSSINLNTSPKSPISNDNGGNQVLGVGSISPTNTRSTFSNYGSTSVDVSTPGENVLGTAYGSTQVTMSGTSMAAPMVAGIAGLLKSKFPNLTPAQIIKKITTSATAFDATTTEMGSGRANAQAALTSGSIFTIPGQGTQATVKAFYSKGATDPLVNFTAYDKSFTGGAYLATGDIDGDGEDEIVTGPGAGGGPQLRVFEKDGTLRGIQFFPFDSRFRGGMTVATGDVDGDGKDEIAVAQASQGQAWVKVYRYNSQKTVLAYFNAFGSPEVGASIAFGDIDNDGKDELVVGAGPGGGPNIRVYDIGTSGISGINKGATIKPIQFFAFSQASRSGISVATGDVDGDGKAEIGASLLSGEEAWTKVYRYNNAKTVLANFRAYPKGVTSGAYVAMGDLTGDGKAEIVTAPGNGGSPQIRTFKSDGTYSGTQFFAFPQTLRGGARVSISER